LARLAILGTRIAAMRHSRVDASFVEMFILDENFFSVISTRRKYVNDAQ
jgi:hypothetical protein